MPNDDREKQFERALTRHLRNASPDSMCPDAETLAAYHERTLSLEEMAHWKEHIAGCARCQESLALVEQTENLHVEEWEQQNVPAPVPQAAGRSSLRATGVNLQQEEDARPGAHVSHAAVPIRKTIPHPPWRWIVPVGALAASVIVWIGVKEIRSRHDASTPGVQVALNRQEPVQTPATRNDTVEQSKPEAPPAKQLDAENHLQKAVPAPTAQLAVPSKEAAAATSSASPPPSFEDAFAARKDSEAADIAKVPSANPSPALPPARVAAKTVPLSSPTPPAANQPAPAGVLAGAAGGTTVNSLAKEKKSEQVPAAAESVEVQSAAPTADKAAPVASSVSVTSTELSVKARDAMNLLQVAAVDHRYIVAPGEKYVWRVDTGGNIQRSSDRGKSWKLQKSGVTADLTAGSAASDEICWVIGKAGVLLLTTDSGKHWKLISSPITEDLGGIHATDALHASIWDVPNHKSYETSDGGATWKRTSNE